jgi:hypothetical protein
MKSLISKGKQVLSITRKAPGMFAGSKESYVNRVATVLEMLSVNFNVHDFYAKHLGTYGNTYKDADNHVDEQWGHSVVDDALQMINDHVQKR